MKAPTRLFVPDGRLAPGESVALSSEEARHVKSRRLRAGESVILLDGRGVVAEAVLGGSGREVRVVSISRGGGEPDRAVHVLLAVAEPARLEWAVEKGTECGAASFTLVCMARSQAAHVTLSGKRLDRYRRIAAEATKQCGRSIVPEVSGVVLLPEAIRTAIRPLVIASPGAGPAALGAGHLSLAIGPEGGLSEEDRSLFNDAGAVSIGLGPRILRLETALVVALARLVDFGRT